jgi:hypothetical protein
MEAPVPTWACPGPVASQPPRDAAAPPPPAARRGPRPPLQLPRRRAPRLRRRLRALAASSRPERPARLRGRRRAPLLRRLQAHQANPAAGEQAPQAHSAARRQAHAAAGEQAPEAPEPLPGREQALVRRGRACLPGQLSAAARAPALRPRGEAAVPRHDRRAALRGRQLAGPRPGPGLARA